MSEVEGGFVLESLNTAKDHTTCQRMGREMAIFLLETPGAAKSPDDLVGAYEDSLNNVGSMKRPFEDFESHSFADVTEAIGTMLSEQQSACVVITKFSTLVVAPTSSPPAGQYVMLNIENKSVNFTKAPEFDLMNVRDVVDVSLVKSAAQTQAPASAPVVDPVPPVESAPVVDPEPESKKRPDPPAPASETLAPPPTEKKQKTAKPRAPMRKLAVPVVELAPVSTPTPVASAADDSSEVQIKTATL